MSQISLLDTLSLSLTHWGHGATKNWQTWVLKLSGQDNGINDIIEYLQKLGSKEIKVYDVHDCK